MAAYADAEMVPCYFLAKDYQTEKTDAFAMKTDIHPLSSIHAGVVGGATAAAEDGASVGDPLTRLMEGSDPLSAMAAQDGAQPPEKAPRTAAAAAAWPERRREILARFTTSQLVTVEGRAGDGAGGAVSTQPTSRARARLAQLEPEGGGRRDQVTQQEFVAHTGRLRRQLQQAWQADQRVRALKLVIQACKLLESTDCPQFYPTVFVLVTDILDVFGGLVYNRVTTKDRELGSPPAPPSGELVSEAGRETCRNWFYKISSIRELTARLFVEMAVVRCYDLLQPGGAEAAARRLVPAIRGLASPLAAGFARCYLSRVAPAAAQWDNLQDFITGLTFKKPPAPPDGQPPPLGPAVDWCLSAAVRACAADCACATDCACAERRRGALSGLLSRREVAGSSLLLMAVLREAGPEFAAAEALRCVEAVGECEEDGYRRCELLSTLGAQLTAGQVAPPARLPTLNAAWRQIQELATVSDYMFCAPAWCGYVAKYFGPRQLRVLLRDVTDHVTPDRGAERLAARLEEVLRAALGEGAELQQLVTMPSFTALLELLRADEQRHRQLSRRLLQLLISCPQLPAEPELLELGMGCCRTMHDSVTVLSLDDERRETAAEITAFLRRAVSMKPTKLESSLDLLVQARGSFCNLEPITTHLVHSVLSLARSAHLSTRRRSLAAACIAFCFVTIPALTDVLGKAKLYAVTAQVALACRCPGQADACIRSAIGCVAETPAEVGPPERGRPAAQPTAELVRDILAALLVFPDQPSQPPLYLVRGLLTALDLLAWLADSDLLTALLIDLLRLLAALAQPRYRYSVSGVDSNDILYGGDPQLLSEINSLADDVIGRVTSHLASQSPLSRVQACQAADLCVLLLRSADQRLRPVSAATAQLYQLCRETDGLSPRYQAALQSAAAACSSKRGGRTAAQTLLGSR